MAVEAGRTEERAVKSAGVRIWRAILIGLVLIPINIYFLLYMEMARKGGGPYPSTISIFANCILFLVALTALNSALARLTPRWALGQAELLIIYVMLMISTSIVSFDYLDVLVPMLTYPFRMATPENKWAEIIWPHTPRWICVSDPAAIKCWYEGNSTLYTWANIRPWLVPIGVWSAVMGVMMFVMFCINTIVRQQWTQHDRLQFPLVELPMQITEPNPKLLKSRLMWAGFAVAGGINLLNGLHLLYPNLPTINVHMIDLGPMLVNKPWNAIGWTPISFFPFAIGFGYLLPLDLLFSCWFFFVMWRFVRVGGAMVGIEAAKTGYPFMDQQALGAYYVVGLFALWSGRKHLAAVWRAAVGRSKEPSEAQGPMSYRVAVWGTIVGMLAVMLFFRAIGLSPWLCVIGIGLYFFMALAVARMHAEFGPPSHELYFMGPEMAITGAVGTRSLSHGDLNALTWFWWFNRAYDSIPIAYQLDGIKIAERSRTPQRQMAMAMAVASIAAVICGFWIYLHFGYQRGAQVGLSGSVNMYGSEAFGRHVTEWVSNPSGPNVAKTLAIVWGMFFSYFLYIMKMRVAWWPFHPLGFAVSTSWTTHTLWFPMLIAWAAKLITFRMGGLKTYRVVLNFFLGLILGDFIVGVLWPVAGYFLDVNVYCFTQ